MSEILTTHESSVETWADERGLIMSAPKSTITLQRQQSSIYPDVTLNSSLLPLERRPRILGVTFKTHFSFSTHIDNIISTLIISFPVPYRVSTFSKHLLVSHTFASMPTSSLVPSTYLSHSRWQQVRMLPLYGPVGQARSHTLQLLKHLFHIIHGIQIFFYNSLTQKLT